MRKTFEVNLERLWLRGGETRKNKSLFSLVLVASLALHALVIGVLAMVITAPGTSATPTRAPLSGVVQATAVSAAQVERWRERKVAEKRRLQEEKMTEQREKERVARKQREAQEAKRAAKREADIMVRKQEVMEAKRRSEAAEARRKAEEAKAKAAAEARRKAEEAKAKAAAEVRRKAEEAKAKAAAEVRRKAEEAKVKAAAEVRRKAEEAKVKAAAEVRRKAEEAKAKAAVEAQLRAEAEARRSRELVLLVNKYVRDIENRIRSVWSVPPGGIGHGDCTIRLEQDRSGMVRSVQIQSCEGNQLYRQSLEEAVLKAAPLPLPGAAEIFDAEVEVTFRLQ